MHKFAFFLPSLIVAKMFGRVSFQIEMYLFFSIFALVIKFVFICHRVSHAFFMKWKEFLVWGSFSFMKAESSSKFGSV